MEFMPPKHSRTLLGKEKEGMRVAVITAFAVSGILNSKNKSEAKID